MSEDNDNRSIVEKFFIPITDLELSFRTSKRLNLLNVKYVGDLVQYTEGELLNVSGFGVKSLKEINYLLEKMNLKLGTKIPIWDPNSFDTVYREYIKKQQRIRQLFDLSKRQYLTLFRNIEELNLSFRSYHYLKNNEIKYIGDLVSLNDDQLLKIKNLGRKSLSEIKGKLYNLKLTPRMQLSEWPPENIKALIEQHSSEIEKLREQEVEELRNKLNIFKLEKELSEMASFFKRERDADIIIKLLGWSGEGTQTLESVGQQHDLSRERVRQIHSIFIKKLRWRTGRKGAIQLPNLERAINYIEENIPNKAPIIENNLQKTGISERPFRIEGILTAAEHFDREIIFTISKYNRVRFVTDSKTKDAPRYIVIFAKKSISKMGLVTAADITAQVSNRLNIEISIDFVKKVLTSYKQFVLLDEIRNWYWHKNLARNRLLNVIRKILSVSSSIDVSDLRSGISRFHRMAGLAPPRRVLLALCDALPWCQVRGSIITANPPINFEEVLEGNEWAFASVLMEEGYVLDRDNFRKACLDLGMNDNTFNALLSFSPIITRFDMAVYGLRGAKVSPGEIASLKPKREYFKRRVLKDFGWTKDGKIWLGFKISRGLLLGGVFSVPGAMKQYLEGGYIFKAVDGSEIGNITIKNFSGWNISSFFYRRGGDIGDILILEFDLSKRIATASLGDEDLLNEYRSID